MVNNTVAGMYNLFYKVIVYNYVILLDARLVLGYIFNNLWDGYNEECHRHFCG